MKNTIIIMLTALLWISCSDDEKVNIKPVAAFKTSEVTIEEGQHVAFTDLSFDEDGQVTKWAWDFGNGVSSEEQLPTVEYTTAGEYTVTLSVWDNLGVQNANTFNKTITVKEKSTADMAPEIVWEFQTPCGFQDVSPAIDDNGNVVETASRGKSSSKSSSNSYKANVGNADGSIYSAAMSQLGVNQDCTALVSNSLAAAGIYFHGWPAEYLSLGPTVSYSQAQPGDVLVYNGHVAIYAGDGMAVHGGFNGNQTVLFSVNCSSGAFQVVRPQ